MRLLTRYVIREMVGPTAIGFGFYTFVILMRNLFDMAEMIIKRSLPAATVLKMLLLSLPHIVVLTIPMSLLFGILIAVGRLSSDSEIIAMRSVGLPTSAIYRPVFYFSAAIFLLNLYLTNFVLPAGNVAYQELRADILSSSSLDRMVKPRVFFDQFNDRVIYVNDVNPEDGTLLGVFMSDTTASDRQSIVVAERGRLTRVSNQQLWLDLQNAEIHVSSRENKQRYDLFRNSTQRFKLVDDLGQQSVSPVKSFREMNVAELYAVAKRPKTDEYDRRSAWIHIHNKFSIPFACLAFGVVALPLGITNRRGGKSSGFTLSIAIILVYYVLLNNGEDLARSGKVPIALAMWTPNIILLALGFYLIRRANREAGSISARRTFFDRLKERLSRMSRRRQDARARAADDGDEGGSLLSRMDIPFPNTLDRYVLSQFAKILLFVVISTAVLFLIVDYTEIAGDITENKVSASVVVAYYRYFVLQILDWVLPLSVLLATLITFGLFSRNNEVTAMKANGVSLYRIALPVLTVAGAACLVSYLMLDFVLPYANERVNQLKDRIRGKETAHAFSTDQRQWIFGEGQGRYLFNFLSFDRKKQTISQIQVFEFDPVRFKLTRRINADEARWDGTGWWFVNGSIRSFGDDGTTSFTPIKVPIRLQYSERPEYFATEAKAPNQMTYSELRRYIGDLRKSGYAADELTVELYKKTSWPFISLVMALIALPFSFRMGKKGALYGVGIAIALAFIYWSLFGVFTKFGEVGNLPAILSAWSANILFAIVAGYMFLRVET